jgi:hypothetical protein
MLKNCDKSVCCNVKKTWCTEFHSIPASPLLDSVRTISDGSNAAPSPSHNGREGDRGDAEAVATTAAAAML